jgi:TrmH family RNA methyltransferase
MMRGIYLRMTRRTAHTIASKLVSDNLRVVLVSTRNPLNLGAAARAMSNFGFLHLRVVNPYKLAFREARSAVGASEVLRKAEEYAALAEAVADCSLVVGTTAAHNRAPQQSVVRLKEAALAIRSHLSSGRCAILFGSEKVGLPTEVLDYCHFLVRIPTRPEHPSMNLGQAVAVCLYELVRGKRAAKLPAAVKAAITDELERVVSNLVEALKLSGYLKTGMQRATEPKVRRLLRRMRMQTEDAELLVGMLRQVLWKLRAS